MGRKCPIPPREMQEVERAMGGLISFEGDAAEVLARIKRDWTSVYTREQRDHLRPMLDVLTVRAANEKRTGLQYGEDQPGLCAWYKVLKSPTMEYLTSISFDDMGRLEHWRPGGRDAQPCVLLDAANVIRTENNRLSAAKLKGAGHNQGGAQ